MYEKVVLLQAKPGAEQRVHPSQCREQYTSRKISSRRTCRYRAHRQALKSPGERRGNVIRFIRQSKKLTSTEFRLQTHQLTYLQSLDVKLLHPFMLLT